MFLYEIRERVKGGEGMCKITVCPSLESLHVTLHVTCRHNRSLACFEHTGRWVDETRLCCFWSPTGADLPGGIDQVLDCKPLGCDIMSAVLPLLKGAACSEREGPGINGPGWQLEVEERDCICCLPAAHHQWFLQLCVCLASVSRRSLPCLGCVIMGQKLIRAGDFPVES